MASERRYHDWKPATQIVDRYAPDDDANEAHLNAVVKALPFGCGFPVLPLTRQPPKIGRPPFCEAA